MSTTADLEQVWARLCRLSTAADRRFLLFDVYSALLLHPHLATPRERVVDRILHHDPGATRDTLERVCQPGHVVAALCWLRRHQPTLLRDRRFEPRFVPAPWRHDALARQHYQRLRASVKLWLRAWARFV